MNYLCPSLDGETGASFLLVDASERKVLILLKLELTTDLGCEWVYSINLNK